MVSAASNVYPSAPLFGQSENAAAPPRQKPTLPPPKVNVFDLLFSVAAESVQQNAEAAQAAKQDLEYYHREGDAINKKLAEMSAEIRSKENQVASWSLALQVFSWMTSFTAIMAGITLIATGVGAVAGALLLLGGALQITTQILHMTGGMRRLAAYLPGNGTDEQKQAVMTWIQLAISFLAIVLAGAGAIIAGYSSMSTAMTSGSMYIGSLIAFAHGITTIGMGATEGSLKYKIAERRKREIQREQIKNQKEDTTERYEEQLNYVKENYQAQKSALELWDAVHQTLQQAWRR